MVILVRETLRRMGTSPPFLVCPEIMICKVVAFEEYLEIGNGSLLNQNAAIKQYANMILLKKTESAWRVG